MGRLVLRKGGLRIEWDRVVQFGEKWDMERVVPRLLVRLRRWAVLLEGYLCLRSMHGDRKRRRRRSCVIDVDQKLT